MGLALMFEWSEKKALLNFRKHGVSFDQARTAFLDPLGVIYDDPEHSELEHREVLVGVSSRGRRLVVGFSERGESIRIISARKASKKERLHHEE